MDELKAVLLLLCSHLRRYRVAWGPGEQQGGRGPSLFPVQVALSLALLAEDEVLHAGLLPGWRSEGLLLRWGTQEEEPGGDRV